MKRNILQILRGTEFATPKYFYEIFIILSWLFLRYKRLKNSPLFTPPPYLNKEIK